jgi:hypothetical protein
LRYQFDIFFKTEIPSIIQIKIQISKHKIAEILVPRYLSSLFLGFLFRQRVYCEFARPNRGSYFLSTNELKTTPYKKEHGLTFFYESNCITQYCFQITLETRPPNCLPADRLRRRERERHGDVGAGDPAVRSVQREPAVVLSLHRRLQLPHRLWLERPLRPYHPATPLQVLSCFLLFLFL